MARQLAAWGCDLVITARRGDRLEKLAGELRDAHDVQVQCVPLDLTETDAPARLMEAAYADGADVDILINNAGYGYFTEFAESDAEQQSNLMQLNMRALVELARRFVDRTRNRERRSYIGNISSMVAYFAVPRFAVYAATKAFVRSFTEALAAELAGTRVSATCVSLGATATEFNDVSGIRVGATYKPFLMSSPRAARIALKGVLRRRRNVIPGVLNRLVAFFAWLLPRRFMSWTIKALLGRPKAPALPKGDLARGD
jgi:short-subunit dehydrogenase